MMSTVLFAAFLALLGPLADAPAAAPNPAATSAPQAVEDLKITQRVKSEFAAWQHGSLERSAYSPGANEQLNDDAVDTMSEHLKPLGPLRSTTLHFAYKEGGSTIYVYTVHCDKGSVRMELGFDTAGKISAVSFEPES